jgi:hypothetical protein
MTTHSRPMAYPIGTVSHGTMRHADLIPDFIYTLKTLRRQHGRRDSLRITDITRAMRSKRYYETEGADSDLESLFDALGAYAGPFMYFGAHCGDGGGYGFWPADDFETSVTDDGGIVVSDQNEIPADHVGYVAVVSDHGNVTLYSRDAKGRMTEQWGIV